MKSISDGIYVVKRLNYGIVKGKKVKVLEGVVTIEFRISNGTHAISKAGQMHKCTTTASLVNETDDV